MGKEKKNQVKPIVNKKGGEELWNIGFTKGDWFDPLKQNQTIEGVFTRTFRSESKFKNTRENSEAYGKKEKVNYEFQRDKGQVPICIGETSGPLQSLFDSLNPGDWIQIKYLHLKREDGEQCPKTVKTFEQLKKWKAGQKAWPVWDTIAKVKRGRN